MTKQKLIEMRTVTVTEKGQIAIPRDIRNLKGFKSGERLAVLAFKDRVELRPLSQVDSILPYLASEKVLSKDWNSKEDKKAWEKL
jgi:AbrB family looped-hinge helix DNA binding protein